MSLKTLIALSKAAVTQAAAKLTPDDPSPTRQDTDLPLGARIGGLVQVDAGQFLIARTLGSIVAEPNLGEAKIVAISRIRPHGWPDDMIIYRYYLATGDRDETERYLQVTVEGGAVKEVTYWNTLERKRSGDPIGDNPWFQAYDGSLGMGLGENRYSYPSAELEILLTPKQFAAIGISPEIIWDRAMGTPDSYMSPIRVREDRIDDAIGETGMSQRVHFMDYVRSLEGGLTEHLWISLEVVLADDGQTAQDVHVDFMIGIPVPITAIRIV